MRPTLRIVALSAALLAVPAQAAAGSPEPLLAGAGECEGASDRSAPVRVQERAMRCVVNHARRAAGLAPVRPRHTGLMRSAGRKAADILACGEFSHTACGRPFTHHMQQVGYATGCYSVAENIAWGSGALGTVRAIMRAWLDSEGHRANLLEPTFRDHGVGVRKGAFQGAARAAIWVHQFGRRC